MSRRYFINDPDEFVLEAAEGLTLAHPGIAWQREPFFLYRRTPASGKVALLSGGGTGHEPLHAGFIGPGMLDGAVPGAVFASPTAFQISAATRHVNAGRGVLHIVKNYTGDVLNFSIAAEIAADEGIPVARVLVDDDLATDIAGSRTGRRGTAATLVVEKICGAAAEAGADLQALARLGHEVVARTRSMALSLDACTHPDTGAKSFDLPADQVEFGVGIHGERGRGRIAFDRADALLAQLVDPLVRALELQPGSPVLALVNGLGATHPTELYLLTRCLHRQLGGRHIPVARTLTGSYVTALDMSGVSITLSRIDEPLLRWWDAPVDTPALRWQEYAHHA
ncbi:dihydroxyacetone kinase subunit DhaK [Castellaniella defragrans]|uniref:dihydroxyacetone kinase subunit DhaK n=1 Tax=Castellaniella defragrans TaxID=75697 RepID=UPI0023F135E6|nr:dihydroxyacetone kinase subunit DhaK [Castellaniella defragrans]